MLKLACSRKEYSKWQRHSGWWMSDEPDLLKCLQAKTTKLTEYWLNPHTVSLMLQHIQAVSMPTADKGRTIFCIVCGICQLHSCGVRDCEGEDVQKAHKADPAVLPAPKQWVKDFRRLLLLIWQQQQNTVQLCPHAASTLAVCTHCQNKQMAVQPFPVPCLLTPMLSVLR